MIGMAATFLCGSSCVFRRSIVSPLPFLEKIKNEQVQRGHKKIAPYRLGLKARFCAQFYYVPLVARWPLPMVYRNDWKTGR